MASKMSLPIVEDQHRAARARARRRHRPLAIFLIVTVLLYCLYSSRYSSLWSTRFATRPPFESTKYLFPLDPAQIPAEPRFADDDDATSSRGLVPLEAHIMSKCPDAKFCLQELILPAMMRVYDKVNFTLSYIGTPTENDGVECKHGPDECVGNIIELCAHHLYPDPKIYLGFTMCLTRDYTLIPQRELVEDCALEHGVDFDKLNDCAVQDDGAFGMGMLRDSVQRSAEVSALFATYCTFLPD